MKSPVKILLLNTLMELAGAQKAMLELASGLMACGYQVTVATMYDKTGSIAYFERHYGLTIINLDMKSMNASGRLAQGIRLLGGLWRLFCLMRSLQVDIVQTFSHYSNILGTLIACLARVPVRVSSQRMSLKGYPGWLLWVDKTIANSPVVQKMVSVSEGTREFSIREQGIRAEKLVTIHNGIDCASFVKPLPSCTETLREDLGLGTATQIVATVARLHPQKGHRFLVDAVPLVLRSAPDTHFLFIGDGELHSELAHLLRARGLESHVHLLGARQDIADLLAITDLFVLPSLWEGLPNSVLEAMAAGLPVIATNVDGCPEIVVDGRTGLLIPPADPEALAEAIAELLSDETKRLSMGQAGRRHVATSFSTEASVLAYQNLYQELL